MTMTEPEDDPQVCPSCALPAVPIMYGYPSPSGAELIHIGRVVGGGCIASRANLACPRGHQWRGHQWRGHQWRGPAAPAVDDPAALRYLDGDLSGAEELYRRAAREAEETLGAGHPDTLVLRHAVAIVLYRAGRLAEGEAEYRAMRAASGHPLTASAVPTSAELQAFIDRLYGPGGLSRRKLD